jgi:hypothetical protein
MLDVDLIRRVLHVHNGEEFTADEFPSIEEAQAASVALDAIERILRREWWLNHGHPYPALYGDDGEMQCAACPMDYKRKPLDELSLHVFQIRMLTGAAALEESK